jgi:hypothetical protein
MIHAFTFCFLSLLLALLIPILGTRVVRGQGVLFEEHKEVAGFIYATIGVLYAVVLGFSVVMMSERYNACIENTDSEAATLVILQNLTTGLGEIDQQKLGAILEAYCSEVIDKEWPQMIRGIVPSTTTSSLQDLQRLVLTTGVGTPGETAVFRQVLQNLDNVQKLRAKRLGAVDDNLVGIVWIALIIGGVICTGFCFLFAARHRLLQIVMTGALTWIILINIDVIFSLQGPYRGDVHISDEPFRLARHAISQGGGER